MSSIQRGRWILDTIVTGMIQRLLFGRSRSMGRNVAWTFLGSGGRCGVFGFTKRRGGLVVFIGGMGMSFGWDEFRSGGGG